uniref:Thioredoxin domain-containing protein n=1 Tax=Chromera velia CCMP2878 TaxID=1169474 RepID=A0A0G4FCH4_9ALVE|eukprot:Cvel_16315.t1-p1 / transcript=Cvel_16315.t1 / gene=Cvel_16315 / organism=Chromera_velia_CCMP2878 / gene_product=hypothetical protein / transcript_product=hypothetical protein / location=Cvel_scaffold1252:6018-8271(-) / protein_length=197 / sequence_SO=supercontig / SO=protein_coding / is_pseudo=false
MAEAGTFRLGRARFPTAILLPRSKDKEPWLFQFYSSTCERCEEMRPVVRRVETELKVKFKKLEVQRDVANAELLRIIDRDSRCGGIPYFFNRKSHQWICGATTFENLRDLADGKRCKSNWAPPISTEEQTAMQRQTGFYGRMLGQWNKMTNQGKEAIAQQREKYQEQQQNGKKRDKKQQSGRQRGGMNRNESLARRG